MFVDFRHALRLLARSPLFTATAVLSLAIGIGATTTIFTLSDALLLRRPAQAKSVSVYAIDLEPSSVALGGESGAERVYCTLAIDPTVALRSE